MDNNRLHNLEVLTLIFHLEVGSLDLHDIRKDFLSIKVYHHPMQTRPWPTEADDEQLQQHIWKLTLRHSLMDTGNWKHFFRWEEKINDLCLRCLHYLVGGWTSQFGNFP